MQISATWMRGGTSKCWVFRKDELEDKTLTKDEILLRSFGSPDTRQLDGIGGATSTTSKAVILSPYDGDAYDVSYLFAQVGIDEAKVDWGSNCGNCSATAGLYAIHQGWVKPQGDITEVRVFNENTKQEIIQRVSTPHGKLAESPLGEMIGAIYPGHNIDIGFESPEGKTTGSLFPDFHKRVSTIRVDEKKFDVTLIDAGAPAVFVDGKIFGLEGKTQDEWEQTVDKNLEVLERVRRKAAVLMGLSDMPGNAERAIPKIGVVGAVCESESEEIDLRIQMLSMGKRHPAMPVTGSVALTLAASVEGTTVQQAIGHRKTEGVKVLTPSGPFSTFLSKTNNNTTVVGVSRTSRIIADAVLMVPEDILPQEVEIN